MQSDYIKKLERLANETVWMPAKINYDGTIENAFQAYVKVRGADKGESNFKKMQRPTRHGYKEGCDLGTYVMNMHVEYEPAQPMEGDKANTIQDGARFIRLGKYVRRSRLSPQDRIFSAAVKDATRILEGMKSKNSTAQPTSTEAESKRNFVA